jgi:hypothetical protein
MLAMGGEAAFSLERTDERRVAAGICLFPIDTGAAPLVEPRAVLTNNARVWAAALIWPPGIAMGIVLR